MSDHLSCKRHWHTREDPLDAFWEKELLPLLEKEAHIRRFDYVKIDSVFVCNILTPKVDYVLVQNQFKLCQDIDILTVAEFIENQEIWDALKVINISYVNNLSN